MSAQAPYARTERSLWTDPDFRCQPPKVRLIHLYLLTGPHAHMSGLSQLSLPTIADDLDVDPEMVRTAIVGPLADRVAYDDRTREIFVRDAGRVQVGPELKAGDNRRVAIERHLEGIHSEELRRQFLEVYGVAWNLLPDTPSEGAPKGLPRPLPSQEQEQRQEQEQLQEGAPGEGAPATAAGRSTGERQRQQPAEPDVGRVVKAIAKPGAEKRWEAWIRDGGDEALQLAIGLRLHVTEGGSDWERGELFATPKVFDSCPGLRGQALSAYWRHANGSGSRREAELERVTTNGGER